MIDLKNLSKGKKIVFSTILVIIILICVCSIIFVYSRKNINVVAPNITWDDETNIPTSSPMAVEENTEKAIDLPTRDFAPITKGLLDNSIDYKAFTADKIGTIFDFFNYINSQQYTQAMNLTDQNEALVESFRGKDIITARPLKVLDVEQYSYQVITSESGNIKVGDATINLIPNDFYNKIISKYTAIPYNELYLDCGGDDLTEITTVDNHCFLRVWDNGELVYLDRFDTEGPIFFLGKNINQNSIYFYTTYFNAIQAGPNGFRVYAIYSYNTDTKSVRIVDKLTYTKDHTSPTCNSDSVESYSETGCLYSSMDEDWFKNNLYYLQNRAKYGLNNGFNDLVYQQ